MNPARNTVVAQEAARAAGLDQVQVVTADASLTDHYRNMVPADIVLACGVFGNISGSVPEELTAVARQV